MSVADLNGGEASDDEAEMSRSNLLRWLGMVVAAVVIAAAGYFVGFRIAGPTEAETDLGRLSLEAVPETSGGIDAYVPIADWGIRARSFDGLFRLELEVRAVDRRGAIAAASASGDALTELEDTLESAARRTAIRAHLWGLAVVVVVAVAIWLARRRSQLARRLAVLSVAFGLLGGIASLALAALSFDAKAFASPSYYGRGAELAQLIDFFERQQDNDRYTSTFDNALSNFSAYLSDSPRVGEGDSATLLLGSDLHNNTPVLSALSRFAGNQPVLLTGDFAHFGDESEARLIAPRIADLGDRVIAVSGNHDSRSLMRALAAEGVTVLERDGQLRPNGEVAGSPLLRVGNLEIAGFPDPLEWQEGDPSSADRVFSFPELENGEEAEEQAGDELIAWFRTLPREPDMVLVHQNALAQRLASELHADGFDRPLTIVTGHNHYQHIDRYGSIFVVNPGTLGAGGPLRVGQEFAGLGQLDLINGVPRSVDFIRIEPLSGQAEADRVVFEIVCPPEDSGEEPCHYEPGD